MKLLFLADLHWAPSTVNVHGPGIREFVQRTGLEAVVIVGDVGLPVYAAEILKRLRDVLDGVVLAIALGNHDLWILKGNPSEWSFDDVVDRFWLPACRSAGVVLLDRENLRLEGLSVVGGYGHSDFGHAVSNLCVNGQAVTDEDYVAGSPPDGGGTWMDALRLPSRLSWKEEARRQTEGIITRLEEAHREGNPVIVAVHTVPFAVLNAHKPDFFAAYGGNAALGRELAARAASVELLVCGHTHKPVDPVMVGGIRCLNVGNDYDAVYGVVYDTKSRIIQWVNLVRGEAFNRLFLP